MNPGANGVEHAICWRVLLFYCLYTVSVKLERVVKYMAFSCKIRVRVFRVHSKNSKSR